MPRATTRQKRTRHGQHVSLSGLGGGAGVGVMRPEEAASPTMTPKIPNPPRQKCQKAETKPRGEEGLSGETGMPATWETRRQWEERGQGRRQSKKRQCGEEQSKSHRWEGGDQGKRKPKLGQTCPTPGTGHPPQGQPVEAHTPCKGGGRKKVPQRPRPGEAPHRH